MQSFQLSPSGTSSASLMRNRQHPPRGWGCAEFSVHSWSLGDSAHHECPLFLHHRRQSNPGLDFQLPDFPNPNLEAGKSCYLSGTLISSLKNEVRNTHFTVSVKTRSNVRSLRKSWHIKSAETAPDFHWNTQISRHVLHRNRGQRAQNASPLRPELLVRPKFIPVFLKMWNPQHLTERNLNKTPPQHNT